MATVQEIVVGRRVKARGCPGLGVGKVILVETECNGIPYRGHVRARVDFGPNGDDGRHVESFSSNELVVLPLTPAEQSAARLQVTCCPRCSSPGSMTFHNGGPCPLVRTDDEIPLCRPEDT